MKPTRHLRSPFFVFCFTYLAPLCLVLTVPLFSQSIPANVSEADVLPYQLPGVLATTEGKPISSPADWAEWRPSLLENFRVEVYGRTPALAAPLARVVTEADTLALDGLAFRRQVELLVPWAAEPGRPPLRLHLLIYQPAAATGPVPVFVGLNFSGNASIATDPGIHLHPVWQKGTNSGPVAADPVNRGRRRQSWPLHQILERGYAVATIYYQEIEPDFAEGWKHGVRAALSPNGTATRFPDDAWGAIGAWAWGNSRILDYLAEEPKHFDARRALVIGHSRLGKAALWAGAQDERFAAVISNNSGEGGAALSHRNFGETIARINTAFPHWFAPRFRTYNNPAILRSIDQHQLLALVAPRPLYVASATNDLWADPRGEFLSALNAEPVYSLHGLPGLGVDEFPPVDHPVGHTLAYHVRSGDHGILAYDWARYLDFADRELGLRRAR